MPGLTTKIRQRMTNKMLGLRQKMQEWHGNPVVAAEHALLATDNTEASKKMPQKMLG